MKLPIYAIICTWNEEDIITSTVRHAFAQGCDAVYIVDNGSTDATLERALSAGAVHYSTFLTRYFNEDTKIMTLNSTVSALNAKYGHEKVWWLYIDADEFPSVPGHATLRSFINRLHPEVRAVKSHMINHMPTHNPYFWEGYHPIDFQPWGKLDGTVKYQLLRYDHGQEHIVSLGGAHNYHLNGGKRLPLSTTVMNLHHFNLRTPEVAYRRLSELARVRSDGTSRLDWMDKYEREAKGVAESMYRRRLRNLKTTFEANRNAHYFATESDFWDFSAIPRWYDWERFYQAVYATMQPGEALEFTAHHLFLRGEFDQALVCFDRLARGCAQKGEDSSRFLYFLGLCFLKTNDRATAQSAFAEALSAKPQLACVLKIKEALASYDLEPKAGKQVA